MVAKKLALFLDYRCNSNCVFCPFRLMEGSMTRVEAQEIIRSAKNDGFIALEFSGGEPTIRDDILNLVVFAKQLGIDDISITTNGRMMSYRNFAQELVRRGLKSVTFSVHSDSPEVHNSLTMSNGSYEQALAGIKNIKSLDPEIKVITNTVITRANYLSLDRMVSSFQNMDVHSMEFSYPIVCHDTALLEKIPRLVELDTIIAKTLSLGKPGAIRFSNIPFCHVADPMHNIVGMMESLESKKMFAYPGSDGIQATPPEGFPKMVKGSQCSACSSKKYCPGIFKEYAEAFGFDELLTK